MKGSGSLHPRSRADCLRISICWCTLKTGTLRHETRDRERHRRQDFLIRHRDQAPAHCLNGLDGLQDIGIVRPHHNNIMGIMSHGRPDRSLLQSEPLNPSDSRIPCGMVTFRHDNFEDILPGIRTGHPVFHDDPLHHLTGQNLVRDKLNDFGQGMGGPERKIFLLQGLETHGSRDSENLPGGPRGANDLTMLPSSATNTPSLKTFVI